MSLRFFFQGESRVAWKPHKLKWHLQKVGLMQCIVILRLLSAYVHSHLHHYIDCARIHKHPDVEFPSVPFYWILPRKKKTTNHWNSQSVKPLSRASLCEGGEAFWAFWRQDRQGSCKLTNNAAQRSPCPSLLGPRSSFWCWSFPRLHHILKQRSRVLLYILLDGYHSRTKANTKSYHFWGAEN